MSNITNKYILKLLQVFMLIYIRNSLAYQMNCSDGYFMASPNLCLPFDARCPQNQLYLNNICYAITQGLCSAGEISINNRCCSAICITNCLQMQSCACCNTLEIYGKLCNQQNAVNLCPPSSQPCTLLNGQPCEFPYPCVPAVSYGSPCQQPQIGSLPPYIPHPTYPSIPYGTPPSVYHSTYTTNTSHFYYPGYPTHPTYPTPPVHPSYPIHPTRPTYPTHPSHPSNFTNTTHSSHPTRPTYHTYPTYTTHPTEPTYPSYPTHPTRPTYPTYPTHPTRPIYPSYPTHPTHATHPSHSTHPTYPSNFTRPTTPTYSVPGSNCTNGTIYMNGVCHTIYCPYGTILKSDRCIIAQCPDGTIWSNGQCILPQPIEHNIVINNTITNQFNESATKSDIVINTYNNLSINSTINLDLNADDKTSLSTPVPTETQTQAPIITSPTAAPSASPSPSSVGTQTTSITDTMANATNKCCIVLSPRVCRPKAKSGHWICTSRRQHVCGDICVAPTIILIPPHIKQHQLNVTGKPIVVMPPEPTCGTLCPPVKNYYDCSGCGIGHMEYCSSYCYHYDCPIQSCRFYEQQTYCTQSMGTFGCQFEDGCYDDWC